MSAPRPPAPEEESVLERNLRALLLRCYVPALPEAAFRERARDACIAATSAAGAAARSGPLPLAAEAERPPATREDARPPAGRPARVRLRVLPPALAAAALLLVTLGALWWLLDDGAGDARRAAILARGEAAVRFAPDGRWESFGPEDDEPADADVARLEWPGGWLEAFTPSGLGLDVEVAGSAGSGVVFARESGGRVQGPAAPAPGAAPLPGAPVLDVELQQGALSLLRAAGDGAWWLRTPHGVVALGSGALSATLQPAGVRLLLQAAPGDGRLLAQAALLTPRGSRALPVGHAMLLREGALLEEPGAVPAPSGASLPEFSSVPEPLEPAAPDLPLADGAEEPPAGPAPRLLQGRVARGDQPVTSFEVMLVPQEVPPRAEPSARTFTAEDGRFAWPDVPSGSYAVFVFAEGAPPWCRRGLQVNDDAPLAELDVTLVAVGGTVSGYVVDAATDLPIAGAVILSEADAPARLVPLDPAELPETLRARTATDATGAFRLENLAVGEQLIRVTAPGYGPAWSETFDVEAGDTREGLLFRLAPGGSVHGRVINENGRPWAEAVVIASPEQGLTHPCYAYAIAFTDAEGRYAMADLPEGGGVLLLMGDMAGQSRGFPSRVLPYRMQPGEVLELDFTLAPEQADAGAAAPPSAPVAPIGCTLHGHLRSADGTAQTRRMVSVGSAEGTGADAQEGWLGALTDGDGAFNIAGLTPGRYEAFVGTSDGLSLSRVASFEVPAQASFELDLTLVGGAVSGVVTDAVRGLPANHAAVIFEGRDTADGSWEFVGRVLANGAGEFGLDHVSSSRLRLVAYDIEGRLAIDRSAELLLAPGAVLDGLQLSLGPGGAVAVQVRDARGAAVSGAELRFTDATGEEFAFGSDSLTDAAGRYEARGLRPGLWFVSATPPAGSASGPREQSLDVRADAEHTLELQLPDAP